VVDNTSGDVAGGILSQTGSGLTMRDTTVSGNEAGQAGGGLSLVGETTITGSTISGNTAGGQGGGAMVLGTAHLADTTISGNSTPGFNGGGLLVGATVFLESVTVSDNSSGTFGSGGGTYIVAPDGGVSTTNSIIAGNPAGGDCSGAVSSTGHNIDSDGTCGLNATGDISDVDPMLGPLADNLGPTQTHALLPGSPALDTADASACYATDQRGVARPLEGNGDSKAVCDIGAFEAGPVDSDGDGCTDEREAQTLPGSQADGGLRDRESFWDFFDAPAPTRDQSVSSLDIFAVLGRFGAAGDPNGDPLSPPPPAPAYHTAYDRAQSLPLPWSSAPADGAIAATDVFAMLAQFGHTCA
jgi:hypothetical protein